MNKKIVIEENTQMLCHRAATEIIALVKQAASMGRNFNIALAGGSTPKALYKCLSQSPYVDDMPWQYIHFFFGDERSVGPEDPDSNYRMAKENLFDYVALKSEQIHRIENAENDVVSAAKKYDSILEKHLPIDDKNIVQFDVVLLGLGPDGHIASLFPGTDIIDNKMNRAAAVWVERLQTWRISITFPLINHARHVWLFVCGEGKADIVNEVINNPTTSAPYPVQMIQTLGEQVWYLDDAAAIKLKINKDIKC